MSKKLIRLISIVLVAALIFPSAISLSIKSGEADTLYNSAAEKVSDSQVEVINEKANSCTVKSADDVRKTYDVQNTQDNGWVKKTDCNGECGYSPLIIVPGIMQSQVYVTDKKGNDFLTVDGFPLVEGMDMAFMFDMVALKQKIPQLIVPLLKLLLFGPRDDLVDMLSGLIDEIVGKHYFNPDGTRIYGDRVDTYWYSLAEAKNYPDRSYNYMQGYGKDENGNTLPSDRYKTHYDFISKQVDLKKFTSKAGEDHVYYYSYSSFGDTYEIASHLNEYIDMVKTETGHSKVNIVFISLGGTIGNVYLSDFCRPDDIDRMVFAAAAIDGTYLLSGLMGPDLALDDGNALYNDLGPSVMGFASPDLAWLGYLIGVVARILPQKLFSGFLTDTVSQVINKSLNRLVANCPSMWALVPSAEYERLSAKLISDEAHKLLKEKTDRYYNIQKNAKKTIQRMSDEGMDIFVVCGYNLLLPAAVDNYDVSSDSIVTSKSASAGATFARVGEKLPSDYVPAIDSSYISPQGDVDAGTAALPDRTWFVRNQSHMKLPNSIHDVIEMCMQIIVNDDITDARVNNGGYAQFTYYRNLEQIESLIRDYNLLSEEQINTAGDEKQVAELKAAYNELVAVYNGLDWNPDLALSAEKRLYKIMYKLKVLRNSEDAKSPFMKYEMSAFSVKICREISDFVSKYYGLKDFVPFI